MSTSKILFLSIMALFLTASCSKEWFTSYSGNMPANERIEQIKLGMSKKEVKEIIGIPSNVVSLDENTWLYMSSEIEQIAFLEPKETERNLLVLKFDKYDQIEEIRKLNRKDGTEVKISKTRTASVGKNQGFFEKYFGGVGQYNPMASNRGAQN